MKKSIAAILVALVIAISIPTSAFAAEADALPDPGATPASPFYFMEAWMQHMNLRFTFGAEAKVKKALQYAEEKLAEMEAMAEQNRAQYMQRAVREYRYCLKVANRNIERAMIGNNSTPEQVAKMMSKHISLMTSNQNCGNEDCQQIRVQAREQAEECQENTIRALANQDPGQAARLNIALMEQECIRMNNCIAQEDSGQGEEVLQQYERLRLMNTEIVATAEKFGNGHEVQEMINAATTTQSGTLSQIRNQLQIGGGGSQESPLQNQEEEQYRLESGSPEQPMSSPEQGQYGNGGSYTGETGAGGSGTGNGAEVKP